MQPIGPLLALFLTGVTGWLRGRVLPDAVGRKSALAVVVVVLVQMLYLEDALGEDVRVLGDH